MIGIQEFLSTEFFNLIGSFQMSTGCFADIPVKKPAYLTKLNIAVEKPIERVLDKDSSQINELQSPIQYRLPKSSILHNSLEKETGLIPGKIDFSKTQKCLNDHQKSEANFDYPLKKHFNFTIKLPGPFILIRLRHPFRNRLPACAPSIRNPAGPSQRLTLNRSGPVHTRNQTDRNPDNR